MNRKDLQAINVYPVTVHSGSQPGKRNPIYKALQTNMDTSPKSEPALELRSRAAPSVEAHHHLDSPDTGRNSGGRLIIIKNQAYQPLIMYPDRLETFNCFDDS